MAQVFETVIARLTELVYVEPEYEIVEEEVCEWVEPTPPNDPPPPGDDSDPAWPPVHGCFELQRVFDVSCGCWRDVQVPVPCPPE